MFIQISLAENVISIMLPRNIVKNYIIFIREKLWIILFIPMDKNIFEITLQIDISRKRYLKYPEKLDKILKSLYFFAKIIINLTQC